MDHEARIRSIIHRHFDDAEKNIEPFRRKYLLSPKYVYGRHARNWKDVPMDFLLLPRSLAQLPARLLRRRLKPLPKSRKVRELEALISRELLDLPGLEQKLKAYVEPHKVRFENNLAEVVDSVPVFKQDEFQKELERRMEDLTIPADGVREALIFLMTGLVGKLVPGPVIFGSALSTGQAAATALYMAKASWFESILITLSLSSVPGWVGAAGAAGGLALGLVTVPLLAPMMELGINKMRSRKVLQSIIYQARGKITGKGRDAVNAAGRLAVYLQVMPDVVKTARDVAMRVL